MHLYVVLNTVNTMSISEGVLFPYLFSVTVMIFISVLFA